MNMAKFHIDKIDGVRGIAILLVLSYHTQLTIFPDFETKGYNNNGILIFKGVQSFILNFNPMGQGAIGVILFLVISGFLIHLIYLKSETKLNIKTFFSKRFWRIYPPYLIVLLFLFINKIDLTGSGIKSILSHIFLVHNLNDKTFFSINPSFWSIALECQLYLIYPVYLFILNRFGKYKTITFIFLIHFLLVLVAHLYNVYSLSYGASVLSCWCIWCSGAFLADRYHTGKKIFPKPFFWLLFFYLMLILFQLFSYTNYFIILPKIFLCVALIETILYSNYIDNIFIFQKIFGLLSLIGVISYSVYLIHQPFLGSLIKFFTLPTHYQNASILLSALFSWLIIFLLSYSLYKLLETKSIGYGQKLRNKS